MDKNNCHSLAQILCELRSSCATYKPQAAPSKFVHILDVIPDAILEIRYYSTYNFVGDQIDGYEQPTALLTIEAANALKKVNDDVKDLGYYLKIFDAYRPQQAVNHFITWAQNTNDTRMQEYFYPNLSKCDLFNQGCIAKKSGHSRGSTVDLTLVEISTLKEVDMGSSFDWFGKESRPDWCGNLKTEEYTGIFPDNPLPTNSKINEIQFNNRMILHKAMIRHNFLPLQEEWWHFTLANEPYPDTYFTYPVK